MKITNSLSVLKENIQETFNKLKFKSKFWMFYIWISLVSLILVPVFALFPRNVKNALILAEITKHVSKLIGIKWHLRNYETLAEERGAVVVANHQSSLDILGMTNIWYAFDKCVIVSKMETLYTPLGLCLYLIGTIFVDRKRGKESQIKLKTKADSYLKNKIKIWICPEGKRNSDPMKMLPFKSGAFITAISSQVPIIPLVYSPYYFINRKQKVFNKGHIIVQCLDPIPTEGLTLDDLPELMDCVKNLMEATYKDLLSEVTRDLPETYNSTNK